MFDAYEISAENDHDVYDSFIIALARGYNADYLITTDSDFAELCDGEAVTYINPIPSEKREKLIFIDE